MLSIFTKIKEFFLGNPQAPVVEAPYKVEAPVNTVPERRVFSVDVVDATPEKALAIVSSVSEPINSKSITPELKVVNGLKPSTKPKPRAKPRAKPTAAQPAKPKAKGQIPPKPMPSKAKPKTTPLK